MEKTILGYLVVDSTGVNTPIVNEITLYSKDGLEDFIRDYWDEHQLYEGNEYLIFDDYTFYAIYTDKSIVKINDNIKFEPQPAVIIIFDGEEEEIKRTKK